MKKRKNEEENTRKKTKNAEQFQNSRSSFPSSDNGSD